MERDHLASRTVVMHNQVVNAADFVVCHHDPVDLTDKFGIRRLSEQWIEGFPRRAEPRVQDKKSHQRTAVPVNMQTGVVAGQRGNQNHSRRADVTQAVRRCGAHGRGVQFFSNTAVVKTHV